MLIQKEFKEGMTEMELAARFDSISASLGSEGPSFKTIVCFGANAALPHHSPDRTRLRYGDFILIDAGAKVQNYCSDITRTSIFGTDKSRIPDCEKKQEMLRIVKDAQLAALRKIAPGVTGLTIHMEAQRTIDTAANGRYKGTFIHALGHSLGIEVHDGPGFSPGAKQELEPGMVITNEPGIYVEGFGGVRIEDDILVTEKGAEVL
jgi:Xaa-Pro aminopeptidase